MDVIVPLYKPDEYRKANLKHLKKWLGDQKDVEINLIVEEQDWVKHPIFNKMWLLNMGVKRGSSDWVVIADVDVSVKDRSYMAHFLEWMKDRSWGFGWRKFIYLPEPGQEEPERVDWPYPGIQEGGIVAFRRSHWNHMGGANEHIRELRGCDNDIAMRAQYLSGEYPAFPATIYHRWHPHSKYKKTAYKKQNKSILKYTRQHPEQVIALLKKQDRGNPKGPYCDKCSFYEMRTAR